ncbi:MAG: hypothetical protein AB3N16_10345, partial [Flavobacteriaceae bacterium]
MKTVYTILAIICIAFSGFSQAIIGNSYITTADNVEVYWAIGSDTLSYKVPLGTKFRVDAIENDSDLITISFWEYADRGKGNHSSERQIARSLQIQKERDAVIDTVLLQMKKNELTQKDMERKYAFGFNFIGYWANYLQFKIRLTDLNDKSESYHPYKRSFTYGVMTLPIKVRFGDNGNRFFAVEENLNLGINLGYKWQLQGRKVQAHNFLVGAGMTRVDFETPDTMDAEGSDNTASALTLNVGWLYQYESFQAGIFFGSDFIAGSSGRDWDFQGKPWLGLALGVSLFTK